MDERNPAVKPKLSKKQRRKRQQRKQLFAAVAIIAVVAAIVGGVLVFNSWRSKQIGTLPADQRVTAVVDGKETEVAPYAACELGVDGCGQGKPFELPVGGAKEITVKVPQDVADHDWSLLKVYEDPGANSEDYFKPNEMHEVTIPLVSDKKSQDGKNPSLTVVEIHTVLVGKGKDGDQSPFGTVWSIAPKR
ncbi:DUF2771 domain-containing protein [Corynebacterium heidelbergense]|uniref:DUF2771 domain-containing protein n=1 Tax=Corynebacterium heidelbergense TaxID=2055947 RepID=A0A364VCC9_9CORY|nr:DUF2771 domain-containing protein [Corynebacterium heidelbergense]RAV34284.1 DUF2771 domain-containing protein [Corynebacterium heidelbergense]WCZ35992.1 hypothetical protein CHEID_02125 [Corynebacterium heidelbergense]